LLAGWVDTQLQGMLRIMKMKVASSQTGFTLTELMVSLALGMSVVGSVLVGYMATYTSSMNTMAASKMNQDLNAVMNMMITEFRRAGYSGDAATITLPTANIFNQVDGTTLEVYDNMAGNTQLVPAGDGTWTNNFGGTATAVEGSCLVYAYDLNEDGVVDSNELGGFRLNNGEVEMRTLGNVANPDTCSSTSNTWNALTDNDFLTVSALVFNLDNSRCLNTREPDGINNDSGEDSDIDEADEADCYDTLPIAASGDITVETRQLSITLTGNLTNDAFVRNSMTQEVRVRNDLVRIR